MLQFLNMCPLLLRRAGLRTDVGVVVPLRVRSPGLGAHVGLHAGFRFYVLQDVAGALHLQGRADQQKG